MPSQIGFAGPRREGDEMRENSQKIYMVIGSMKF
jgi:hypothetical protein